MWKCKGLQLSVVIFIFSLVFNSYITLAADRPVNIYIAYNDYEIWLRKETTDQEMFDQLSILRGMASETPDYAQLYSEIDMQDENISIDKSAGEELIRIMSDAMRYFIIRDTETMTIESSKDNFVQLYDDVMELAFSVSYAMYNLSEDYYEYFYTNLVDELGVDDSAVIAMTNEYVNTQDYQKALIAYVKTKYTLTEEQKNIINRGYIEPTIEKYPNGAIIATDFETIRCYYTSLDGAVDKTQAIFYDSKTYVPLNLFRLMSLENIEVKSVDYNDTQLPEFSVKLEDSNGNTISIQGYTDNYHKWWLQYGNEASSPHDVLMKEDRLYVPLGFLRDECGIEVLWDEVTKSAILTGKTDIFRHDLSPLY